MNKQKTNLKLRIVSILLVLMLFSLMLTSCANATVVYQASEGGSIVGNVNQTVGIGNDSLEVTAKADDGYFFVRWSDGWKYPQRQDKEVQEDTTVTAIFAPKTRIFKILMIYIVEIQATLATKAGIVVEVDYRLTDTELKLCELISLQMGAYLNDMMDGLVCFEIDTIFTTEVVREEGGIAEGICFGPNGEFISDYGIIPYFIPELQNGQLDESEMDTFKGYNTVVTTFNFNDYDNLLHHSAGSGGSKYAQVSLESKLSQFRIAEIPYEALFDLTFSGYTGLASWDSFISTYIHEFTHTIESAYWYNPVPGYFDYHSVMTAYKQQNVLNVTKQYLLGKVVVNGETGGIPQIYWDQFLVD